MAALTRHIVPAILPKDRAAFFEGLTLVGRIPGVSRVQIDVVDGRFATPASWPYTEPGALAQLAKRGELLPQAEHIEYEVDLMCFDAERAADLWLMLGATRLTIHAEAVIDIGKTISGILARHGGDMTFGDAPFLTLGLAVNASSPLSLIEPYLAQVSYVQFMGIDHIGKQGQPFNPRTVDRVAAFHKKYPTIPIQVDGGESLVTAPSLLAAGASDLIVGSKIVRAENPSAAMREFLALVQ